MPNPFNYGTPVPPNKFVGRWPQVRAVVDELLNPSGQSYAVIGGKRSGKSSFLEAVQHELIARLPQTPDEGRYVVPLMVDLKRLSLAPQETSVFGLILQYLYQQFTSELGQERLGIKLPLDLVGSELRGYIDSGSDSCSLFNFTRILEDFLKRFTDAHNLLRLVILIDEVDTLTDRDWAKTLFANARSLIYQGSIKDDLRYVLAGSSRILDLRDDGSPFLNMLDVVYLHSLSDADVNEIIAWAGNVPNKVAAAVRALCGGHPYLVQYVMRNLWTDGISRATPKSVAAHARKFTLEHQAELLTWLVDIDERGKNVYHALIQANGWQNLEEVQQTIARPADANPGLVRLCYHGLVIQKDTYGRFKCSGNLFKNWFLTACPPTEEANMTTQIPEYKRKARTKLLEQTIEDYNAVTRQLAGELNAVNRKRLERQAEGLELEIEQLRRELGLIAAEQPLEPPSKTTKEDNKTTSSSKTVYGTDNRWAVLVGVNAYEDKANYGQLHVCVGDVTTIRDRLITGGFDADRIHLLTDDTPDNLPIRAKIINALQVVANATKPDDLLLFYYSGHGDELEGESYLVSRDGHRASLADTGVPVSRIEEIMQKAKARAKVIVLDACHSGVDFEGKKGTPQPLSPEFIKRVYEQAKGIAILASCEQGQVSYEWAEEGCSAFTYYVREALAGKADFLGKGFVSVDDVHKYTLNELEKWATKRSRVQAPTLESKVEGDIILTRYKLAEAD